MLVEPLTDGEKRLMTHVSMFGSDGYPIRKLGNRWIVDLEAYGRNHPGMFLTKRAAVKAFESFEETLRDRSAADAMRRAGATQDEIESAMIRRELARREET